MQLLARLEEMTGRTAGEVLVITMEYGPDFSGPDKDTFRTDRATGDPLEAHRSNFLHPVLYYYKQLPTGRFVWLLFLFRLCVSPLVSVCLCVCCSLAICILYLFNASLE